MLTLDQVQEYLTKPKKQQLTLEEAIAYVCYSLLQADTYGYGLIKALGTLWDGRFLLSPTIYEEAATWLENNGFVEAYREKGPGRGRPRRMLRLKKSHRKLALDLASLWQSRI